MTLDLLNASIQHASLSEDIKRPVLHVEVCLHPFSTAEYERIAKETENYLRAVYSSAFTETYVKDVRNKMLHDHVKSMRICEVSDGAEMPRLCDVSIDVHVYQLNDDEGDTVDNEEDEESVQTFHMTLLPSVLFHGLWESLVYDENLQYNLLDYVYTTILFSEHDIDSQIISWNRVVLLHGPPGTGKTSLCKALSQKLAIRLSDKYAFGKLIEINAHSLFSKWFSESGKMVMKLFQQIHEIVDEQEAFVYVLIDEVESLTSARKAALSGAEPSDSIRVVNALLTQIDRLKRCKNVLVMATSNLSESIDLAFVDRADIKQYVGPPSQKAIYKMLHSCVNELIKKKLVTSTDILLDAHAASLFFGSNHDFGISLTNDKEESWKLWKIAESCGGLSGRSIRKLPFLAFTSRIKGHSKITVSVFLNALAVTVEQEKSNQAHFASGGD